MYLVVERDGLVGVLVRAFSRNIIESRPVFAGVLAGGTGGHGFPPTLLYVRINVLLYSVIERGKPWICGVFLSDRISRFDEGAGFCGQARLIIRHSASWYVSFGSFEKHPSQGIFSLRY